MRPSFLGLIASGLLILTALILIAFNFTTLRARDWIFAVLLASIAVATHSMLHAHEERWYNFNPLRGEWNIRDEPIRSRMTMSTTTF